LFNLSPQVIDSFLTSSPQKIVTVEEHVLSGGFSSLLLERINDLSLDKKVIRVGISNLDPHLVGSQSFLQTHYGITPENIVSKVISLSGIDS
jgi:1-deoxy-D-xylulose-5-phosphate synthase